MVPNCNRCDARCPHTFLNPDPEDKKKKRTGMVKEYKCKSYIPPKEGWQLIELVLKYPDSLNKSLSVLPFEVNLNLYLKRR